jgi:hypothetical protein
VALIGYCLMSNHVHLIAMPTKADGLAEALKQSADAMPAIGMSLTNQAGTCGKDDIILALSTRRTSGKHCATPS